MTVEEGVDVLRKCIGEIQKRLVINQPRFAIKVVSKDGIKIIDAADSTTPGKTSTTEPTPTDTAMETTV